MFLLDSCHGGSLAPDGVVYVLLAGFLDHGFLCFTFYMELSFSHGLFTCIYGFLEYICLSTYGKFKSSVKNQIANWSRVLHAYIQEHTRIYQKNDRHCLTLQRD
jgi:hypothetical protein